MIQVRDWLLVELVLPEEFLTLISTAGVALILIIYVVLVVKLRPSKEFAETGRLPALEPRKDSGKPNQAEEAKTPSPKPQPPPPPPAKESSQQSTAKQRNNKPQPQREEKADEKKNGSKEGESKKSFYLFGEKNFEGCPHKFGYLKSLPKNMPIPDECFGCGEILECVRNHKANGKQQS